MRMKFWILGAALSLLAASHANALKVYKATSEGLAHVKVYVTDSEGLADCVIYVETSEGLASSNSRWYYETSEGLADVSIYFTDTQGLADKKIYFTKTEGMSKCDVDWKSYKKQQAAIPRLAADELVNGVGTVNTGRRAVRVADEGWTTALGDSGDSMVERFYTFERSSVSVTTMLNNLSQGARCAPEERDVSSKQRECLAPLERSRLLMLMVL
jgi:predicted porin